METRRIKGPGKTAKKRPIVVNGWILYPASAHIERLIERDKSLKKDIKV